MKKMSRFSSSDKIEKSKMKKNEDLTNSLSEQSYILGFQYTQVSHKVPT